MPHIYINEKDNTVAGSMDEENTNIVYVPGCVANSVDSTAKIFEPTLFKTTKAFREAVGDYSNTNLNAVMAEEYLKLGLLVLFESFGNETDFTVEGKINFDGIAEAVDWTKLKDRGLYKVKFLTTGAASSLSALSSMTATAKYRGDCIALIDHEKEITTAQGDTYADAVRAAFEAALPENQAGSLDNSLLKYAAAFSPWCTCTVNGVEADFPASFVYLSAYGKAKQSKQNPNWFAYAGSMRGLPPFSVTPLHRYGDVENGILQGREFTEEGDFDADDNKTWAINPISNIDPFGNIVWGNRTLLDNSEKGGLTASSFLNIRNLVCDIKKRMYKTSRKYTFEQNDDILWANFSSDINELLDQALSGRGIRGSRLTPIPTDIKGRLKAHLVIIPVEAAEDFDLTLEMADSLDIIVENA